MDSKQKARKEYMSRINRVIDYVNGNLDEKLTVENLAKIACFSQFHFHRIFKSVTGETLYGFIKRIRLEKSVFLLTQNPDMSITEIAYYCGFSSSSNYAYAFKEYFGASASDFRKNSEEENSRISKVNSRNTEDKPHDMCYTVEESEMSDQNNFRRYNIMKVDIKDLPGYHVAYVRHIGKYEDCGTAWETLCRWAGPRDLFKTNPVCIGISYDDPAITPAEKCRYDAAFTVPEGTEVSGEVSLADIPAGRYAVYRFEDRIDNIGAAFNDIFSIWMPESGYQADDRQCLEIYLTSPDDNPERRCTVDICIPVRPL